MWENAKQTKVMPALRLHVATQRQDTTDIHSSFTHLEETMQSLNLMDPPKSVPSRFDASGGSLSSNQSSTSPPDCMILTRSKSTVPTQVSRVFKRLKMVKTMTDSDACPSRFECNSNVNVSDQCGSCVSLRTWVCFLTLPSEMVQYGLHRRLRDCINLLPATMVTFTTRPRLLAP